MRHYALSHSTVCGLQRLFFAVLVILNISLSGCATTNDRFVDAIDKMERETGGRIGAYIFDSQSGQSLAYRANERFATASTFKPLLVAAVLAKADAGKLALSDTFSVNGLEIQPHSPIVAELAPDDTVTLAELCAAIITISDNTATNMLFDLVGGPPGLTRFLREHGDTQTRMDRYEVELNTNVRGDERDTSTPRAIAHSYLRMLMPDVLSEESRALLSDWLVANKTGLARLRAGLPADWRTGDKTGYGANGAVNNVAVTWPPAARVIVIAVFMSWSDDDVATLNAIHARIAALAVEILRDEKTMLAPDQP